MILITSAKYVTPELQSEFGKIPPSFLPLGGKRLYEYQAKLFESSCEKIVLSLPESFKVAESDKKKLGILKIEILFIPDGLSLGESIVYAINMNLPIEGVLEILHGDTYFEHLESINNSVSSSLVESDYDWTYLIQNSKSLLNTQKDCIDEMNNHILSGYFNIDQPYKFVQAVVQANYSFINGLVKYSKKSPFMIVKNNSWLDFGLVSNYYHSKKRITTERVFNSLVIEHGFVTKTSTLAGKLDAEINWFNMFPSELSLYVPRFYAIESECSYKTEYLYTSTLSELYVFGRLPLHVWSKIFISLRSFLAKLHSNSTKDEKINFNYAHKTRLRIKEFASDNNISLTRSWVYNGNNMPSIDSIINDLDKYLVVKNESFKFIHGDFCFSNIMYDFKSNDIKIFDPRGADFVNKITVYGDERYDFAKLMHSIIGLYDYIISGFYHCRIENYKIEFDLEITADILMLQDSFLEIFELKERNEIYAIMIHLFASMLPLHNDDSNKQNALLANMFRLYEEFKEECS